ncbi:MAG: glycerol-3-phosphate 1-O-acyltransferase PlsY, partial [Haemophilus parahaemolyticus]|uniref:glycerol-3-phosphate 1-O-acyltransferase PlsY n=1 Tax=Haemophilus parahaemolyticus TaxID=735 RepID=UPI0027FAC73B
MTLTAYLMIFGTYLLGSVSSAIIFCRLAGLPDPRENGSKNPGATNVLRIGGRISALGVLLFDVLKGMLPVALALRFGLEPSEIGFIALAACLGHVFPIFFRFRGGKGVATALGTLIPFGMEISGL